MGNEATKVCSKCGKELPLSEFYKHTYTRDGLMSHCKGCHYTITRKNLEKRKAKKEADSIVEKPHVFHKVYLNPELAKFQPKDLIAELRARGYSGELCIKQTIVV